MSPPSKIIIVNPKFRNPKWRTFLPILMDAAEEVGGPKFRPCLPTKQLKSRPHLPAKQLKFRPCLLCDFS
jgi:hypothetical protein